MAGVEVMVVALKKIRPGNPLLSCDGESQLNSFIHRSGRPFQSERGAPSRNRSTFELRPRPDHALMSLKPRSDASTCSRLQDASLLRSANPFRFLFLSSRLQIILQALGTAESHLLLPGQSELPHRSAPPKSVSVLSTTKVPQNGNAT